MLSSKAARTNKSAPKKSKPEADHSPAEKAAVAKAIYNGIVPGSEAAHVLERKKSAPAQSDTQVEVLRRIPANDAKPELQNEESRYALQLAADIEQAVQNGDLTRFSPQAQQALLGVLCKLYAANHASGDQFAVFNPQSNVTATDAMILCGEVLKATNLQVFELGLWLSWSSR